MTSRVPIILDVDTGVDDAVALALAVAAPTCELIAVTTVAGNVGVAAATENTLRILDWLGSGDVPVHRGATHPLVREHVHAEEFHGANGIGNADLPPARARIGPDRGPAAIIRHALARPGELTLVCTGPLTNLAIALNVEPALVSLLKRVVIMGGAFRVPGNINPYGEFNIVVDPEAAQQVFAAGFPDLIAVGLDVTHQVVVTKAQWEAAGAAEGAPARLIHAVSKRTFAERGYQAMYLHDPLALLVALQPDVVDSPRFQVAVALDDEHLGQTVLGEPGTGHQFALEVDADRVHEMLADMLGLTHDVGIDISSLRVE